jgi:hypothetical protein
MTWKQVPKLGHVRKRGYLPDKLVNFIFFFDDYYRLNVYTRYFYGHNPEGGFNMSLLKKFFLFFSLSVIAARPSIAADSLVVSPLHPTTTDSIRLSIIITAVTLNDSTITLNFTDTGGICPCPVDLNNPITITVLTYKRGPLPAGNYSVYEESQSCNGLVCPEIIIRSLIGKFTVSKSAVSIYQKKSMPLEKIGKASGNVCVFDTRGVKVGVLKHTPGVFFIKSNDDISSKLKILF